MSSIETRRHQAPIVETPPHAAWSTQWANEADTQAFARRLAASPAIVNCSLSLHGDMGAGKTTLVRHLLRALGVQGRIKSPTYAVVEPHSVDACALLPDGEPLYIWHFDFYRFNDPREWEDAGFRELFASPGLKLVEWPERAAGFLPPMDASIHLETAPMTLPIFADDTDAPRLVSVDALSPRGAQLLLALQP